MKAIVKNMIDETPEARPSNPSNQFIELVTPVSYYCY